MSELTIHEILKYLPHRYPFLMIDRVVEYEADRFLAAVKNVTVNEPFFTGHFPNRPVMPGVMILEALAQATGLLAFRSGEDRGTEDSLFYLVGIDQARFKRPVEPGDQLRLEVTLERLRRGIGVFRGEAKVEGQLAASAELMCTRRELTP
ncbi:MAG: 3-hydroxyacyl-ACP dehydratase FabZ [Gammaproteobacteria bacterium]|nr:3-hydroxyacyl-ACP dehydratase FabZ [Gammaproteobacteria bacterium]